MIFEIKKANQRIAIVLLVILFFSGVIFVWRYFKTTDSVKTSTEMEVTNIFELALPVEVLGAGIFLDGGTIAVFLKDSAGKKFLFNLDGRIETTWENQPRHIYVGADHPDKEGARKIPYGGEEEKEILRILESWDSLAHRDEQERSLVEGIIKRLKERVVEQ